MVLCYRDTLSACIVKRCDVYSITNIDIKIIIKSTFLAVLAVGILAMLREALLRQH